MVALIWAWLTTRVGRAMAGILLALSILAGTYTMGRKAAKDDLRIDGLEDYKRIREEIDEVDPSTDPTSAFERLRANGWLR